MIWPENSTDIDPFSDPTVYADIQMVVDALGVPILVGAMVAGEEPEEVYNQGIVWEPGTGPGQRYSKRHPVPFGEYIPFREQLARTSSGSTRSRATWCPATEPGVMEMNGITFGDVICFEVAYDDVVREAATDETRALVVQTNNATYMGTGQVEQQFAIARLRAIETGRPVVVAATNGVSGVIDQTGEVSRRPRCGRRTVLTESGARAGEPSVGTRRRPLGEDRPGHDLGRLRPGGPRPGPIVVAPGAAGDRRRTTSVEA